MTGGRQVEAKFEFQGRLAPESFREFARRRALRLSLELDEGDASTSRFVCQVRGPLALVDAFEMACSLGPLDCLVMEIVREDVGTLT